MFKPKFDLNVVEENARMFLILKNMLDAFDHVRPSAYVEEVCNKMVTALEDAHTAVAEFEAILGPIPHWAVCKNFGAQYIVGAQLFTTNGRRSGNGWIVKVINEPVDERLGPLYVVLTDAGSVMKLTRRELERAFEAGDWICDPERIIKDFDRDGYFAPEHPEGTELDG